DDGLAIVARVQGSSPGRGTSAAAVGPGSRSDSRYAQRRPGPTRRYLPCGVNTSQSAISSPSPSSPREGDGSTINADPSERVKSKPNPSAVGKARASVAIDP